MKYSAWKYSLPFIKPFKTAGEIYNKREGVIMLIQTADFTAVGEAAPLPGFCTDTADTVAEYLVNTRHEVLDIFRSQNPSTQMESLFTGYNFPAALEFGLDTLAIDYEAKKQHQSFHQLLFGISAREIPVNGLISLLSDDRPVTAAERLVHRGYATLKIKTGGNFDYELQQLNRIRNRFPSLSIRIDANRSWAPDEALSNLAALERIKIEYCEEPLAEPTVKNYRQLRANSQVPLAIDESFHHENHSEDLLSYISTVILKPMVTGSFAKNFATIDLLDTHDITTVITTSLESCIGRTVSAVFASGRGSPDLAHGLSTGDLFREDFHNGILSIKNGTAELGRQPGLGDINYNILLKNGTQLFEVE